MFIENDERIETIGMFLPNLTINEDNKYNRKY
jgi:hypothetical protein